MTGRRIKTLAGLYRAARNKRAVICPDDLCFRKPRPAAFVISMQGTAILRAFRCGMYLYKKENDK